MDMDLLGAAIRIIIALPLVTALAYFLIKHGLARRTMTPGIRRRMRLIEQLPIGPKTTISLVEVGGQYILLAHSENGVQVIREMDDLPGAVQQQDETVDVKEIFEKMKTAAASNRLLGKYLSRKGKA